MLHHSLKLTLEKAAALLFLITCYEIVLKVAYSTVSETEKVNLLKNKWVPPHDFLKMPIYII